MISDDEWDMVDAKGNLHVAPITIHEESEEDQADDPYAEAADLILGSPLSVELSALSALSELSELSERLSVTSVASWCASNAFRVPWWAYTLIARYGLEAFGQQVPCVIGAAGLMTYYAFMHYGSHT